MISCSPHHFSWPAVLTAYFNRLIDCLYLSSFIHLLLLSPPKIWLLCLTCLHLKLFVPTALGWGSLWLNWIYYQGVGLPQAGLACVWINPSVLKAKFWKHPCSSSGAHCCLSYRVICLSCACLTCSHDRRTSAFYRMNVLKSWKIISHFYPPAVYSYKLHNLEYSNNRNLFQ